MGATTFIRVGTCGSFQDYAEIGDVVIFDSAMRSDGASHAYAPPEYPAVAHHEVVQAGIKAGHNLDYKTHVGTTRSADAFYAGYSSPGSSFGDFWQSWWRGHLEDLKRLNVIAAEMEASIIFVLARLWGLRAGGISVVLDNVFDTSDDHGQFDPETAFEHNDQNIRRVAVMGCEMVRILSEGDG